MKKILAILSLTMSLIVLLNVPVLAEEEKPEKLTLIGTNDDRLFYEEVGETFTQETGIELDIITQAYDSTHNKIVTTVMGGGEADILYCDTVWPAEFAQAGLILPLDDYLTDEYKASLYTTYLEQLMYDGHYYAIPHLTQSKWLFYNREMLEKAGYEEPPKTYEELFEMSRTMIEEGICKYGIAWPGAQAEGLLCDFTSVLYAYGGQYTNEAGEWVFNSEQGVQALQMILDSIADGTADPASVTYTDRDVLDPFMAGDTAFVSNWAYAYNFTNNPEESAVAGNVEVTLMPGAAEGVVSSSVTGGGGLAVASNSAAPEWAVKFIQYLTGEDVQKLALKEYGVMPILKSVLESEEVKQDTPHLAIMAQQFDYVHFRPALPNYNEWSQMMQLQLNKAITSQVTAQEALDEAVSISNEKY